MGALVKRAAQDSEFTLGSVAHLAGKETPYVSKCFDAQEPHAVLKMIAAILYLDKTGAWLRGVAEMAGYDIVKRQELTDAEYRKRIEAWARKGKLNAAAVTEALKAVPVPEDEP